MPGCRKSEGAKPKHRPSTKLRHGQVRKRRGREGAGTDEEEVGLPGSKSKWKKVGNKPTTSSTRPTVPLSKVTQKNREEERKKGKGRKKEES